MCFYFVFLFFSSFIFHFLFILYLVYEFVINIYRRRNRVGHLGQISDGFWVFGIAMYLSHADFFI